MLAPLRYHTFYLSTFWIADIGELNLTPEPKTRYGWHLLESERNN